MKVDAHLDFCEATHLADTASASEDAGYEGIWRGESDHDAFISAAIAAQNTTEASIGTGIAVAFARNPMHVAYQANDLQLHSKGRFILGLGSQVRAHIVRRFSMPWSQPVERMREYIRALRTIWTAWETGERLSFNGQFYTHNLMAPFFSPGPNPHGNPPIMLAGVGPKMTKLAGEATDGLILHPFTTPRYIREVINPRLEEVLTRRNRDREDFSTVLSAFVVTGTSEEELRASKETARRQIAFYASTPSYRVVLETHGWGDLGEELHEMSRRDSPDRWDAMQGLIDDEILETFAVVGRPGEIADGLQRRFYGLVDRLSFYRLTNNGNTRMWDEIAVDLKEKVQRTATRA